MSPTTRARDVAGGFAVAVATLCLAVYLRLVVSDEPAGRTLTLFLCLLAILAVTKATFSWGELRGFPVRRQDRRLHFPNLVRNLVMAALATFLLFFLSGPVVMAAAALAR